MTSQKGQSKRMSLLESIVSVIAGYVLTVLIQMLLFPMFGVKIPMAETMLISIIIVAIAFVKNYGVRRLFNSLANIQQ